jgi:hypothetical protein
MGDVDRTCARRVLHSPKGEAIMKTWMILAVMAAGAAACSTAEPLEHSAALQHVEAGDTIRLEYGGSASLGSTGAQIVFRAVEADSRCPVDVMCVWAGDAHVQIEAASLDGTMRTLDLHTTLEPMEAEFAGFRIRLIEVAPSRMDGVIVKPADYSVRLAISRG